MLITIPGNLQEKLGEEASKGLIELLNTFSENTHNSVTALAEEKFERRLSYEIGTLRKEMYEMRADLLEAIAKLRSELMEEISMVRAENSEQNASLRSEFAKEMSKDREENTEQHESLRSEFNEKHERLRSEFAKQMSRDREENTRQREKLRSELIEKIEKSQTSTIRWMFLFWVGQIGALIGILFAFFS